MKNTFRKSAILTSEQKIKGVQKNLRKVPVAGSLSEGKCLLKDVPVGGQARKI